MAGVRQSRVRRLRADGTQTGTSISLGDWFLAFRRSLPLTSDGRNGWYWPPTGADRKIVVSNSSCNVVNCAAQNSWLQAVLTASVAGETSSAPKCQLVYSHHPRFSDCLPAAEGGSCRGSGDAGGAGKTNNPLEKYLWDTMTTMAWTSLCRVTTTVINGSRGSTKWNPPRRTTRAFASMSSAAAAKICMDSIEHRFPHGSRRDTTPLAWCVRVETDKLSIRVSACKHRG